MNSLFNPIQSISASELAARIEEGVKLLDVRTAQEYQSGHIRQAINVPLNKIDTYSGKEQKVYVICQSGMRSKKAAKQLEKKGYEVINVRGGMNQWTGATKGGK